MTRLRLSVEIKKQTSGVEFDQLARVYAETNQFLQMLADDTDLLEEASSWIAVSTKIGSYTSNLESTSDIEADKAEKFRNTLRLVVSFHPETTPEPPPVRRATMAQYARIGAQVAPGQAVRIGISDSDHAEMEWGGELSPGIAQEIAGAFPETVEFYGDAQGRIHALFKETSPPYFKLRGLSAGDLINCIYKPEMYQQVVELLEEKDAVILVAGSAKANSDTRKIESIHIDRMEWVKSLSVESFESLGGSAPNITGDLSTEDFIDRIRGSGDDPE